MKILFDQCTPEALREALPEHHVQTADEARMGGLENGELIDEAVRRGYDLLVTADRRMQKQQEIEGKRLRVVVLTRPDWLKAKKQINEIRRAIATAEPGKFTRVLAPRTQPHTQVRFKERDDGLFDITETLGSRGQSRTLRSAVTMRAGLEWLADTKRIAKHEIPRWERNLLSDLKRDSSSRGIRRPGTSPIGRGIDDCDPMVWIIRQTDTVPGVQRRSHERTQGLHVEVPQVRSKLIWRPPPGVVEIAGGSNHAIQGGGDITITHAKYPSPPSDIALSPNVQNMYERFMEYRENMEPLSSMAYFCVTVLEHEAKCLSGETVDRPSKPRKLAATTYGISKKVLDKIRIALR